jgi:L-ascorbate metabolism protein UlaG (beta-lactamase superfamily)
MKRYVSIILLVINLLISTVFAQKPVIDTISTNKGDLTIQFLGHASLILGFNNQIIQVDPFSPMADYSVLPKADLVLITHSHPDHFDINALTKILKENTMVIYTQVCANTGKYAGKSIIMKNGDVKDTLGINIKAVPAYNIEHKRPDGNPFHPKGEGNGYVVTFGDKSVYIAGDTENILEMKYLGKIDIAFLPMNLPYTMTPEQVADAAKIIQPKILYPYHYGDTDTSKIIDLLKNSKNIEVRIRAMK